MRHGMCRPFNINQNGLARYDYWRFHIGSFDCVNINQYEL